MTCARGGESHHCLANVFNPSGSPPTRHMRLDNGQQLASLSLYWNACAVDVTSVRCLAAPRNYDIAVAMNQEGRDKEERVKMSLN